jgi:hypothetical protein
MDALDDGGGVVEVPAQQPSACDEKEDHDRLEEPVAYVKDHAPELRLKGNDPSGTATDARDRANWPVIGLQQQAHRRPTKYRAPPGPSA